jgi:hypothetical protein
LPKTPEDYLAGAATTKVAAIALANKLREADIEWQAGPAGSVATDPSETSSLIASEAGWGHIQIHQCRDHLCSWMQLLREHSR